jgi:hypothetical protein
MVPGVDADDEHAIEVHPEVGEHRVEFLDLLEGAGVPVEQESADATLLQVRAHNPRAGPGGCRRRYGNRRRPTGCGRWAAFRSVTNRVAASLGFGLSITDKWSTGPMTGADDELLACCGSHLQPRPPARQIPLGGGPSRSGSYHPSCLGNRWASDFGSSIPSNSGTLRTCPHCRNTWLRAGSPPYSTPLPRTSR